MFGENNNSKKAYASLCATIEKMGVKYKKDENELAVYLSVTGDDLPMDMVIYVDEKTQTAKLISPLPFKMSENKRIEGAIAACVASYALADSNFDFDFKTGKIVFRISTSFIDSVIGEEVFEYMISCAYAVIDRYNEMFLAIDRDILSISKFIDAVM